MECYGNYEHSDFWMKCPFCNGEGYKYILKKNEDKNIFELEDIIYCKHCDGKKEIRRTTENEYLARWYKCEKEWWKVT